MSNIQEANDLLMGYTEVLRKGCNFKSLAASFGEQQHVVLHPSSSKSPHLPSLKAYNQQGVQIKQRATHSFTSTDKRNTVAFKLPASGQGSQVPTVQQPPAHRCTPLDAFRR